ncbi:unnamed protein product [Amoebophrya sp. A120]|nr:unnamed protein product [Amoebophrya sp. A120]|eukprot:GSA120T00020181001.1
MDGRPPSKRSSGLVVHREGKQFHSVKELCEDWAGLCEQIANHPLAVVRVYELVDADAGILLAECGAGALGSLAPLPEAARGEDPALESLRNSQIEDVIAQRLEKRSSRNANAEDEEHLHPHPLGGHTKKVTRRHSVGSSSHIVAAAGGVAQSSASRINAQGNQQNYAKAISAEIASEDERLERHRQQVLGFGGTNEPRFSKNAENKRRMLFQPSSRSSKNSATSAVDHVIQLDARAAHAWHTAKILHEADPICRYARALNREERRRFYSRAGESAGNVQNVLADAVQHYLPNKALRFDPLTIRAHSARLHEAADAPALREQHDDFHYYADEEVAATDNTNRADVKRSSEAMLSHAKDKDRLAGIDMLHTAVYRASVVAAARLRSESHDGTRSSAGTTELERQESSAEPTARDTTSQRSPRGQRGLQKAWDQVQKRRLLVRTTLRMVGSRDTFDFRDYFSGQSVTTRKSGVLAAPKAAEPRRISQSDRMLCTAANDPWFQFGLQALAANEPVLESTRMAFPLKTPPARKAFTSLAAMGMVVISTTDGLSLEAYARKFLGDAATSVDPRTSALSSRERMKELEIDVDRCVDSLWAMTKSLSQEWDAWNARRAKRVLEGVTFAMIHALEEVTTHEGRAYHDDILPVICSVAKELVGCERVAFWAHDPQTHQLYLKEQTGGALMRGTRISENAGMLGECMRAHAPITLAQNANAHPGYNPYTDAGGELVKIGGTVFHRGNTVENMITVPIFEYDLLSSGDAYMIGQIDQGQDAVLRGALNQANATQPGRRKTGGRRTTATSLAGRLDSKEVGGGEDASSSAFVHSAFRPTSVNVARRRRTEKVKGEDFTSFRKRVTTEALEDVLAVQRRPTVLIVDWFKGDESRGGGTTTAALTDANVQGCRQQIQLSDQTICGKWLVVYVVLPLILCCCVCCCAIGVSYVIRQNRHVAEDPEPYFEDDQGFGPEGMYNNYGAASMPPGPQKVVITSAPVVVTKNVSPADV